jgi:hypothetical protein
MSNTEAVIFMGWNAGAGTRLDRTYQRGCADRRVALEAAHENQSSMKPARSSPRQRMTIL